MTTSKMAADGIRLIQGDALTVLKTLPSESVHMAVCSPPYWHLRSYLDNGHADKSSEIGMEESVGEYVDNLVTIFREMRRVLRADATFWLNIADSYAGAGYSNQANTGGARREDGGKQHHTLGTGLPQKSLLMVPARVALALQADGWLLRSMAPWVKRSSMPESVEDRPASAVEYIFMFAKSQSYFFDMEAVRRPNSLSSGKWGKSVITKTAQAQGNGRHGATSFMSREMSNEEVLEKYYSNGRSRRNADWWFESMGMATDGDEILGYDVNPQPFAMQLCTACGAVYDGAEYRRLREDTDQRRVCACGRADAWLSHYASFPEALVRPMVQAGSSEYGVCSACSAPYERVMKKIHYEPTIVPIGARNVDLSRGDKTRKLSGKEFNEQFATHTTGWAATCACNAPVRPAVVLDIFSGTGTTCVVAMQEGRHAIGIDLSENYNRLATERIRRAAATLRYGKQGAQERRKAAKVGVQQLELLEAAP